MEAAWEYVALPSSAFDQPPVGFADQMTVVVETDSVAEVLAAVDAGQVGRTEASAGTGHSDCKAVVVARIRAPSGPEEEVVRMHRRAAEASLLGCARPCARARKLVSGRQG